MCFTIEDMEIKISVEKRHLYVLGVFLVLALGVFVFAGPIGPGVGYHTLQEIVDNEVAKEIVDSDANGVIDNSDKLEGNSASYFQRNLIGNCNGQVVVGVDGIGNFICEPDDLGGGGGVTQVDTGSGLTGGPITSTGTISVADGGITNSKLSLTVTRSVACIAPSGGSNTCTIGFYEFCYLTSIIIDTGACDVYDTGSGWAINAVTSVAAVLPTSCQAICI